MTAVAQALSTLNQAAWELGFTEPPDDPETLRPHLGGTQNPKINLAALDAIVDAGLYGDFLVGFSPASVGKHFKPDERGPTAKTLDEASALLGGASEGGVTQHTHDGLVQRIDGSTIPDRQRDHGIERTWSRQRVKQLSPELPVQEVAVASEGTPTKKPFFDWKRLSFNFNRGGKEVSIGWRPHAEGPGARAYGISPTVKGDNSKAVGLTQVHAEGTGAKAHGFYVVVARGDDSEAIAFDDAMAFGNRAKAAGIITTLAIGDGAQAKGFYFTVANGKGARSSGVLSTLALGKGSKASGIAGVANHGPAESLSKKPPKSFLAGTFKMGGREVSIGWRPVAKGDNALAFGWSPTAIGDGAKAIGFWWGRVEGKNAKAQTLYSPYAEGDGAEASSIFASVTRGPNTEATALAGALAFGDDSAARAGYFGFVYGKNPDARSIAGTHTPLAPDAR